MQKLFFLFLIVFAAKATAQPQKGDYMVGAGLAGASAHDITGPSGNAGFGISLHPQAGYFLTDKFVLGAATGLGFSHSRGGINAFDYAFSPFVRFYFGKNKPCRIFAEALTGVQGYRITSSTTEYSSFGMMAAAGPGISYAINRSVALESVLRMRYNSVAATVDPHLTLGFQVYLPGKHKADDAINEYE